MRVRHPRQLVAVIPALLVYFTIVCVSPEKVHAEVAGGPTQDVDIGVGFSIPRSLADLVEINDELVSLPKYINGIRLLPDNRIVLSTWQDSKKRRGPDEEKARTWIPGEMTRWKLETSGVPKGISSRGYAWFSSGSSAKETDYFANNGSEILQVKAEGVFEGAPMEDSKGRVWIFDDAHARCLVEGKWHIFRTLAKDRDGGDYWLKHRLIEMPDGTLLVFPRLATPRTNEHYRKWVGRSGKHREKPGYVPNLHMWYFPKGDLKAAQRIHIGQNVIKHAALLPDGSWLLRPRRKPNYVWRPDVAKRQDEQALLHLIERLDSESWPERERATQQIQAEWVHWNALVEQCLLREKRPEVRWRLKKVLDDWKRRHTTKQQWQYRTLHGKYRCLDANHLQVNDRNWIYLAVWGLTQDPSAVASKHEPSWSDVSLVRYDRAGKFELLSKEMPRDAMGGIDEGNVASRLRVVPTDGGILVSSKFIYLIRNGKVRNVYADFVRTEKRFHSAPDIRAIDSAGRIYYKWWDRIRIHPGYDRDGHLRGNKR